MCHLSYAYFNDLLHKTHFTHIVMFLTVHLIFSYQITPYFQVQEDSAPGTVFYTLRAADPDVNGTDGLNFAAAEPITAVDKNGKQINNTEEFKV